MAKMDVGTGGGGPETDGPSDSDDGGFVTGALSIDPKAFVATASGAIKWRRLATLLFGTSVLAWSAGVIEVILTTASELSGLIDAMASFWATLIRTVWGLPEALFATSWGNLERLIAGAGPASYLLAVVAVLVVAYIYSWGVSKIA